MDGHTSDICKSLDGEVFPISDYQVGVTAPPFHVNCRSTTAPHLDENFNLTADGEKTYRIPDNMSYDEWKKTFVDGDKAGLTNRERNGIIKIRNRIGNPVEPLEKTLEMALDPETYAYTIADRYNINLRAGGKAVSLVFDECIVAQYGKTRQSEPNVIRLGRMAFYSEEELANTIAHELNHCRSFARGGNAPEETAYAAGDALAAYIRGER